MPAAAIAIVALLAGVILLLAYLLRRAAVQAADAGSKPEAADFLRLRALENIGDSFFAVDRDWRFLYVNRKFIERYGRGPASQIVGRSLWEVYPELAGTEMGGHYRRAMEEGVASQFDQRSYISDRWFRVVVEPTEVGISVSATDISELKRTEESLRAAKEDAERARAEAEMANQMKDQFLATLSHELRTPVHAIAGWTQILRSGQLDAAGKSRALDVIERNARLQAQLIGDLLDLSRVTSGKLRLEMRPAYPLEIVEAALASVRPAAEAREVRIERTLDPGAGPVLADPDRLEQIVVNLLGNAVKFTPRGGWVEIRLEEADGAVRIQVRDGGQGIEPELLPHVFDFFWQADASTTRRQGGLGLGLAIVRQLVELHGGAISAASPGKGEGATFTVSLPLAQPQRVTKEHPVVEAERDGYDLIREIRALGHDAEDLPAVAVTAFASPEDRRRALDAGFQVHLAKPVDPHELTDVIAGLAKSARESR